MTTCICALKSDLPLNCKIVIFTTSLNNYKCVECYDGFGLDLTTFECLLSCQIGFKKFLF